MHYHELEQSLRVAAWLEHGDNLSDVSLQESGRSDNGPLSLLRP